MTYPQYMRKKAAFGFEAAGCGRVGPLGRDSRPRVASAGHRPAPRHRRRLRPAPPTLRRRIGRDHGSLHRRPTLPPRLASSRVGGPSHPGARPERPGCHGRPARRCISFAWPASSARPKSKRARALAKPDRARKPGSTDSSTDFSPSPKPMKRRWPEVTSQNRPSLSQISSLPVRFAAARRCCAPAPGPGNCSTSPVVLVAPPEASPE